MLAINFHRGLFAPLFENQIQKYTSKPVSMLNDLVFINQSITDIMQK